MRLNSPMGGPDPTSQKIEDLRRELKRVSFVLSELIKVVATLNDTMEERCK